MNRESNRVINTYPCSRHPKAKPYKDGRCGECYRVNRRRYYDTHGESSASRYSSARANAARKGVLFTLTFKQWSDLIARPCVYASMPDSAIRCGIDQIVPKAGYTPENSQSCCAAHNLFKSDFLTHEQATKVIREYSIPCGNSIAGRKRIPVALSCLDINPSYM